MLRTAGIELSYGRPWRLNMRPDFAGKPRRTRCIFEVGTPRRGIRGEARIAFNVARFANPKGIESFSPGLRGTSYPGSLAKTIPTRNGLNQTLSLHILRQCRDRRPGFWSTRLGLMQPPSGLRTSNAVPRVGLSESANPGLNDPIPLGLLGGLLSRWKKSGYSTENSEEPKVLRNASVPEFGRSKFNFQHFSPKNRAEKPLVGFLFPRLCAKVPS